MGLLMAFVSNCFVLGVEWFTSQREHAGLRGISFFGLNVSFAAPIFLLSAAGLVLLIKRVFGIERYHGQQIVSMQHMFLQMIWISKRGLVQL